MSVIDLSKHRLSKEPHTTGTAVCMNCKHEWEAVAPVGTVFLECPNCTCCKGVYKFVIGAEEHWECNCGCDVFFLTRTGVYCCMCGDYQQGF